MHVYVCVWSVCMHVYVYVYVCVRSCVCVQGVGMYVCVCVVSGIFAKKQGISEDDKLNDLEKPSVLHKYHLSFYTDFPSFIDYSMCV